MNLSKLTIFQITCRYTFLLVFLFSFNIFSKNLELSEIKLEIEKNYYSFDLSKHNKIIKDLKKIGDSEIRNYYLSFEYHTIGKIIYNDDNSKALKCFENSIVLIEKAIKQNPKTELLAEYYALLSSSLGKKSSLSGLSAFYWGLEAKKAFDNAFNLDSNNSKVRFIGAVHLMHVPEILGGDKNKARNVLKSLLVRKQNNINPNELNWVEKAEIFAYLAQIDILENKSKSVYIDSALYYEKNYDFVKIDLKRQMQK